MKYRMTCTLYVCKFNLPFCFRHTKKKQKVDTVSLWKGVLSEKGELGHSHHFPRLNIVF